MDFKNHRLIEKEKITRTLLRTIRNIGTPDSDYRPFKDRPLFHEGYLQLAGDIHEYTENTFGPVVRKMLCG